MIAVIRQRLSWAMDTRLVVGVLLVAVSIVGGLRLAGDPVVATPVYVASTDLDAGHVLTSADVEVVEVRAPREVLSGWTKTAHGAPVGRILQVALRKGSPLVFDRLGGAAASGREITVPATPEHALGGEIRAGDRIDLLATFDKGTDAAKTVTVARAARVSGVVRSDGLFGAHAGAVTALTLGVDPDDAVAVAFAARNAELDVVRAHGDLNAKGRATFSARQLP